MSVSLQSQEDSEFRRTHEEVVQLNRQISNLLQAGHSRFPFPICTASTSVKPCAFPHRRTRCCAHLCWKPRPMSPSCTQSWTSWRTCTLIKVRNMKGDHSLTRTCTDDPTYDIGWCVSLQREGWFEEDGGRIPGIFQSDPASSVSLFFT